ncbi:MAG: YdcF family protein [Allobaculum sp.]|nr:YdcF family protein [Allobaculum sp.]
MLKKTTQFITALLGLSAIGASVYAIHQHFLPKVPEPHRKTYPFGLLLGCKAHDDGTPTRSQIYRCDLAVDEYEKGSYQALIISGGAVKNDYVESEVMRELVHDQNEEIPVICETSARTTWENLEKTKALIGDVPILIMTGSTHARRAAAMAAHFFSEFTVASYNDWSLKKVGQEIPSRIRYCALEIQKNLQEKKAHKELDASQNLEFIDEENPEEGEEDYYEFFAGEVEPEEDESDWAFDDSWK